MTTPYKIKAVSDGKLERRRRLIEATITAVARYGLNRITLEKVAKLAGLVAGTVNFHFNGKDELLLESMRYLADIFSANLQNALKKIDKDPVVALNEIIDIHVDPDLSSRDKIVAWYSFWVEVTTNSQYRTICNESEAEYNDAYIRICEKILSAHKSVSDLQVQALAKSISGMMNQVWEDLIVDDSMKNREKNRLLSQAFFASIFPWLFELPQSTLMPSSAAAQSPMAAAHFPAWIFINEGLVELECKELFKPSWQWLGSEQQLPHVGCYKRREVCNQNVLMIRNSDHVRAFYNICKHHPHEVIASSSGQLDDIVCGQPYGWTYDLNGSLQQWPANLTLTLEEKTKLALGEIPLQNINHSLWICFNQAAQMNEHSATYLRKKLSNIDFINHTVEHYTERVNANWKIVIDMYLSRQMNNMQKAITINEKYTTPAPDIIEQSVHVHRRSGERIVMMPNMILFVIEDGLYLMQFSPVSAKETDIAVFAIGVDKPSQQLFDNHLQKVMALTVESQRCLTPYGYSELFAAEVEPARTWWRATLQNMLPVLRLSVAPVLA